VNHGCNDQADDPTTRGQWCCVSVIALIMIIPPTILVIILEGSISRGLIGVVKG
jgi:ABC-type glycerol-3-phosphate transport system permease component